MSTNLLNDPIIVTDGKLFSDHLLKDGFTAFLKRDFEYKQQFLQTKYNRAFDGYSYLGQKDSINQYDTDMLHSFVLSDFAKPADFPKEFAAFFDVQWAKIKEKITTIELELIDKLGNRNLKEFYNSSVGHMVSCNYYPPIKDIKQRALNNTRLSTHKDVSLFTTFPFGVDEGLAYYQNKQHFKVGAKKQKFSFAGYLLEYFTEGKIMALDHQVELPNENEDRFSFAFFSIVKPDATITINKKKVHASRYYRDYLNLF